jgi:hypothetical protein
MRLALLILFFASCDVFAQSLDAGKSYYLCAVGFWNVENLYDTLNDPLKNDDDFTPSGINAWSGDRYRTKIDHLAEAISQMATDVTPDGLAVLGLCEIENISVLRDLVASPRLAGRHYRIVHIEGPDIRGVDPALLYNPAYFTPSRAVSYKVTLVTDASHATRDILAVSGNFAGDSVMFIVNHWPSRRGGEMASRPNRIAAAKLARRIADSALRVSPSTRVLIMGDLNDDPVSESVKKHIGTYAEKGEATPGKYFNPTEKLYRKGIGTLAWQDAWNLFDQVMLSGSWINGDFRHWQFYRARVFNKPFLKADFGNFSGYPFRTYSGGAYSGGYSDHFPTFIVVAKESPKDPAKSAQPDR